MFNVTKIAQDGSRVWFNSGSLDMDGKADIGCFNVHNLRVRIANLESRDADTSIERATLAEMFARQEGS